MLLFCFCLVLDLGVFLLCFPWLTQSGAKDSVLSENWCFRLRPAFWGGEETMEEGVEATSGTFRDLQQACSTDSKSEKIN